ncbi:MAG TPA: hypothetical protein VHP83_15305 [Aggregatilineaceae bacterium]|nr:hypothetical protein [Aggregatilineaceae bacterium]
MVLIFHSDQALIETMDQLSITDLGHMLDFGHAALITGGEAPSIVNNNVSVREGGLSGAMIGTTLMMLGFVQFGVLDLSKLGSILAIGMAALTGGLIGGLIGYLVAFWIGFGFSKALLYEVGSQLTSGEVALLLQMPDRHVARLQAGLVDLQVNVQNLSGRSLQRHV